MRIKTTPVSIMQINTLQNALKLQTIKNPTHSQYSYALKKRNTTKKLPAPYD